MNTLVPTGPHEPSPDAFDVSVVIATRNRGQLLARALASVMAQRYLRVQALVVDDGSRPEEAALVDTAVRNSVRAGGPVAQLVRLPSRPVGHGPSFARNSGAALATGRLLAFLDDDDEWTEPLHLQRCAASLSAAPDATELLLGDQRALHADGSEHPGPLWLRGLEHHLHTPPDAHGAREADVDTLLAAGGLCHLNTVVMPRRFFLALGGFDERLRYEEDRDLLLRALDAAQRVLYQPAPVGIHHIPDRQRRDNVTTSLSEHDKRLAQLLLLDKALLCSRRPACRHHARRAKGTVLKHLAVQLAQARRPRDAQAYRMQALGLDFSLKWLAYTALGALRTIGAPA